MSPVSLYVRRQDRTYLQKMRLEEGASADVLSPDQNLDTRRLSTVT